MTSGLKFKVSVSSFVVFGCTYLRVIRQSYFANHSLAISTQKAELTSKPVFFRKLSFIVLIKSLNFVRLQFFIQLCKQILFFGLVKLGNDKKTSYQAHNL